MAKFNITVELDWIDEEYNLDEEIREAIVDKVVNKVQDKLIQQVDTECSNRINDQMANIEKAVSDKLNSIMDSFFDEPRDITDRYGDVIKKGVTVREGNREDLKIFHKIMLETGVRDNFLIRPIAFIYPSL